MNEVATSLDKEKISANALKVVNRLREQGYEAYLVGGCVRDVLLGKVPKDFDVATSAHPEEVRELFRNSRLIGKRFRIVHVRFGGEIVEVSTFRGRHKDEDEGTSGMVRDDNVYGTFTEDVMRRDFTMNALYWDGTSDNVEDQVDGIRDLQQKKIRLIGEPDARFREDPVRMLRAIRFKAKLDFDIEDDCAHEMRSLGYLLQDVSSARLFEEVLKLFMNGTAVNAYQHSLDFDIYGWLFPSSRRMIDSEPKADLLIREALSSTDRRVAEGLPVTPAFIYAAILWYPFLDEKERLEKEEKMPWIDASRQAANEVLANQQMFTSIPRRFSGPMRDIWNLQFRLPVRFGNKPDLLMGHKRFRAAYDFMLLREATGENLGGLGDWWTRYQEADESERQTMKQKQGNNKRKRKRKRRPDQARMDSFSP